MRKRIADFVVWVVLPAAFWLSVVVLLVGCRTKYVSVPEYHYIATEAKDSTKYVHLDYTKLLSVFRQRDSTVTSVLTTITRNERGDTTARETQRTTEHWHSEQSQIAHYKHIADSLRRELESRSVRVDSIRVPYPVERPLSRWDRLKLEVGGIAIGALGLTILAVAACIVVWLARKKRIR